MEPGHELLDPSVIDELRSLGDATFLASVVGAFFDSQTSACAALAQAVAQADPQALERTAHRLKSSCSSVGARRAAELCLALELKGRSGRVDEATQDLGRLEDELVRVGEALRALLSTGGPP